MQNVAHGGGVQIGGGGDAALIEEREAVREGLERPVDAIAARAAQFDQIVGRGKRDQQPPAVAQNPPELARIHPRGDREQDGERPVGDRHDPIGIGHHPLALRVAPRGCIHRRDGDIDAMGVEVRFALDGAEVEAVAAAGIQNHVVGSGRHGLRDRRDAGVPSRPCHAIAGAPPRRRSIARMFGAPLLRLQQVDVAAARDIEGVSARADHPPLFAQQWQMTAAH